MPLEVKARKWTLVVLRLGLRLTDRPVSIRNGLILVEQGDDIRLKSNTAFLWSNSQTENTVLVKRHFLEGRGWNTYLVSRFDQQL